MARAGWLNENSWRAFPFVVGTTTLSGDVELPEATVVDAGFVFGPHSGYVEGTHSIQLTTITRAGSNITLRFATDAPGCASLPMDFTFALSDANATNLEDVFDEDDETTPVWSGYCIVGDLDDLAVLLPADGSLTGTCGVEPALVRSLVGRSVRSIRIANADRSRVGALPEECDCYELIPTYPPVHINDLVITGHVRFEPGYNCHVYQRNEQNAVVIGAGVGDGDGEPCAEVSLVPGETPPNSSLLLDNSPACNELVRSINGLGGPTIQIVPGAGVVTNVFPQQNKITIDINMRGLSQCVSDASAPVVAVEVGEAPLTVDGLEVEV